LTAFFLIISLFASLILFRVAGITGKSYHRPFNSFFLIISLFASLIFFRVAGITGKSYHQPFSQLFY
jgi:hypothetical protein